MQSLSETTIYHKNNKLILAQMQIDRSSCKMCGRLFAFWTGRNNNGPISERTDVRKGNVNTRVVKLQPVDRDTANGEEEGRGHEMGSSGRMGSPERSDQR
jgi:hypothetical protein